MTIQDSPTTRQFGHLAEVFKLLALGEVLACLRPSEYWESHAGPAATSDSPDPAPERLHGIHFFASSIGQSLLFHPTTYHKVLARGMEADRLLLIPGSPLLAREFLSERTRRFLFCDTDADALHTIRQLFGTAPNVECIQDDGLMILRGAAMLLPDSWTASTLAFIDPPDIHAASDSDISPLQLWCELANRGIRSILSYSFSDPAKRLATHAALQQTLDKARLLNHGIQRFEGTLCAPLPTQEQPTPWGFGLLAAHLPGNALEQVDKSLRALESLYSRAPASPAAPVPAPRPFTYTRAWM
jgi:hypothetical protein